MKNRADRHDARPRPTPGSRGLAPTGLGVLALLALAAASALLAACGGEPGHGSAGVTPEPVRAPLGRAERIELPRRLEVAGTVEAGRTAAVSARVMAMVTAIHADAGERVERGQLLVSIDPQAAQGQVSQAQGALAQARAALSLAERNHRRFEALAEREAASQLEADVARMQYEQALGAVEQAEGAVAAASSVAADSQVTAPFTGRVARRMVDVGDLAAPGRPLLTLESDRSRRLAVSVPESTAAAAGLALGAEVAVTIDSRPDLGELPGRVVEMAPADPLSHSVGVKLELSVDELPTGAAGRARIEIGSREAVAVPPEALLAQGGLTLVVVRDADGRAVTRVVTEGAVLPDGRHEVLSGLSGGETLLLGLATAPPAGAPVEVVAEAATGRQP